MKKVKKNQKTSAWRFEAQRPLLEREKTQVLFNFKAKKGFKLIFGYEKRTF